MEATTLFDFHASSEEELSFPAGIVIKVEFLIVLSFSYNLTLCPVHTDHSGPASQRSWSRHTILNKQYTEENIWVNKSSLTNLSINRRLIE